MKDRQLHLIAGKVALTENAPGTSSVVSGVGPTEVLDGTKLTDAEWHELKRELKTGDLDFAKVNSRHKRGHK